MILRNLRVADRAISDRGGGYLGRERGRVSPEMPAKNKREKQNGGLTFTFTVWYNNRRSQSNFGLTPKEESRMKNVVAYIRVSTDGQTGEDKFGLDVQREKIEE